MSEQTSSSDASLGSPERFGYSWDRFNSLTPEQEQQFLRWTAALDSPEDWRGKTFLDVGCGAGRNSYWAMKHGATGGVAIDLDERSLEAARRNLANHPQVEILHESAYDIPFKDRFDIAFSIGVIHHLEKPADAVHAMVEATRPGGTVLLWVYGYENMALYVNVLKPLRRLFFSRLPITWVRALAFLPTAILWLLLRLGLRHLTYFKQLRTFPFMHLHHIIFDQMLPRIANYWKRDEVENLLRKAGLQEIHLEWVNEMSWSARGTRPSDPGE